MTSNVAGAQPNLFLVGAPRAGTTAMHEYLGAHPEIYMSPVKEPHFFGSDLVLRGARYADRGNERRYLELFADASGEPVVGESSPGYLISERAAQEIRAFSPDAKVLVMLRSPADLVVSLHNQSSRVGDEVLPLADAIDAEDDRRAGRMIPSSCQAVHALFYRENVQLHRQLRRFLDVFGSDRVYVVVYDDFRDDTAGTYRSTLEFLGVSPEFQPELRVVNPSRRPPGLSTRLARVRPRRSRRSSRPIDDPQVEEVRRRLRAELAPVVNELSVLLGRDLSHWNRD